jgi:hypothetical protein
VGSNGIFECKFLSKTRTVPRSNGGFGAFVVTGGWTAAAATVMFARIALIVVCDAIALVELSVADPYL